VGAKIAARIGGGPWVTTIVAMAFLVAGCMYAGFYIAPHVERQIGKAVGALLDGSAWPAPGGLELYLVLFLVVACITKRQTWVFHQPAIHII